LHKDTINKAWKCGSLYQDIEWEEAKMNPDAVALIRLYGYCSQILRLRAQGKLPEGILDDVVAHLTAN